MPSEIRYHVCLDCRVYEYVSSQTAALWHDGHNIRSRVVPFNAKGNATIKQDIREQAFIAADSDIKKLLTPA